jgi:hypothetical protein
VYDRDTRTDIPLTQVPVTLKFNVPMTSITTYDPIDSTTSVASSTNTNNFTFVSSPDVTLVEIKP